MDHKWNNDCDRNSDGEKCDSAKAIHDVAWYQIKVSKASLAEPLPLHAYPRSQSG
jgi:hypothetical protein